MMLAVLTDDPAMVLLGILCLVALVLFCLLMAHTRPRLGRSALVQWLTGADIPDPQPPTPPSPVSGAPIPRTVPPPQAAIPPIPAVPDDDALPGLAERRRLLEQAAKSVADGTELMERLDRWEHGSPASDRDSSLGARDKEPDSQSHKN
jgi:hypothetical protein